jgi:hypothetical protein
MLILIFEYHLPKVTKIYFSFSEILWALGLTVEFFLSEGRTQIDHPEIYSKNIISRSV